MCFSCACSERYRLDVLPGKAKRKQAFTESHKQKRRPKAPFLQ
jgi:hypothetical protein